MDKLRCDVCFIYPNSEICWYGLDCGRGTGFGGCLQNLSWGLSGDELLEASAVLAVPLSCVSK